MDVSAYPTEHITPLTQAFPLHQVKSDTPSHVILEHSSVATLEDRGPTFINDIMGKCRQKRILKNCIECNTAHRRCVFELADNVQCIRCIKFNLCCKFRYSGMCLTLLQHVSLQLFELIYQCLLLFFFLHTSEQGRRNDLHIKKLCSSVPLSTDQRLPPPLDVSSDSVHCNALTQSSTVSYAFSCHTTDTCGGGDVESSSTEAHIELNDPNPSWVHVFSKTNSTQVPSFRVTCLFTGLNAVTLG